jgi:zinc protease
LKELEAGWNDEIIKLINGEVSDAELNRVKAQVIAGQVFSGDSVLGQASRMGRMWAIGFAPDAPDVINEKLSAITPLQVQEVAKKYLVGSHTTSAILEPKIIN